MCPLRLILIFLSATLAGFFVLRSIKSEPQDFQPDDSSDPDFSKSSSSDPTSKVSSSAMQSGFWTVVDMASGRYLWRHMFPSSSSSKRSD